MSDETIAQLNELIGHRAPELDELDIDWFGGEPLLAPSVIDRVMSHIDSLRRQHGFQLIGSMTTNGFLLDEDRLTWLVALGVRRFQITLDGEADTHDMTRQRQGGGPTFGQIWTNLCAARDSTLDFAVSMRLHYSPANLAELPRLLRRIRDELDDSRFRIVFKAIGHYGGPNDEKFEVFSAAEQRAAFGELVAFMDGGIEAVAFDPGQPVMCYASEPNSMVIRSNGAIAKCTVAFEDPRNEIGHLRPGGLLDISAEKLAPWVEGIAELDPNKLACPQSQLGPPLQETSVKLSSPPS